ncbi:MAG: ATP-binding cassette domain-containing protein, partial [Hyphomonas sp.]|nr:ATP-binding cassette domain-containing protein [Hyphomonas sp.]
MIKLWRSLGSPGLPQFRLALMLSAISGASAVLLMGLSGWFLTASALAGLAGTGLVFNHLYPSAGVRAAAFIRVLSRYAEQLSGHDATLRLSARMRPKIFSASAHASRGLAPLAAADLSLLLDDVEAAEGGFLRVFSPMAMVAASALAALCLTFAADILTGTLALAAFGISGWWLPRQATRKSEAAARTLATETAGAREDVARLVENAVELDVLGALPTEAVITQARLEANQARLDLLERPFRSVGAINTLLGTSLALACLLRAADGSAPLPLAAGAALALLAAFDACAAMVKALDAAPRASDAATRLAERIGLAPVLTQPPEDAAVSPDSILPIDARELTFSPAEGAVLIGPVTTRLEPGMLLEVLGPSGCGKTTFAETLMRLHPVQSGTLTYDGIAADRLRIASVLQRVALSPQFPAFLPGTLRQQLKLANPAATDSDMTDALALAGALDFVRQRADGLETMFANAESGFSGGELRRIGLARALLAGPQVLILDEPFAGLQPALAEEIADRLAGWAAEGDRAVILLQHAASTFGWPGLDRNRLELA